MPALFTNNASGKLASGINGSATSIVLAAGQGALFPSPSDGDFFYATLVGLTSGVETSWEIVKCTARSTDTLTVVRAQESTPAVAWNTATKIELRLTALGLDGKVSNPMITAGDMIVGGVAGVPTRLAKGTALQVLRINADATAHEYADPAGGEADLSGHLAAFAHGDIAHTNRTALNLVSGTNTGDQDLSGYSLTSHSHIVLTNLMSVLSLGVFFCATTPTSEQITLITETLGITSDEIIVADLGQSSSLVFASLSCGATIENMTLALAGGSLTFANLSSAATIEGMTLVQDGGDLVFADLACAATIGNMTLEDASAGNLVFDNLSAGATIENMELVLAGGSLVFADLSCAATVGGMVLEEEITGGDLVFANLTCAATIGGMVLSTNLPINESFGTDLGVFSVTGGTPTVSGGDLVLNNHAEEIRVPVIAFGRGFRLTVGINMPDTVENGATAYCVCRFMSGANYYDILFLQESRFWDDGEGGSGYDPFFIIWVRKDGTALGTYERLDTGPDATFILEVQSGGGIVAKEGATTRVSVSDNTYTSFTRMDCYAAVNGGTMPTFNIHSIVVESI